MIYSECHLNGSDKGKPGESRRRKAMGLRPQAMTAKLLTIFII